jgi:SAM-dependent methyltransferase
MSTDGQSLRPQLTGGASEAEIRRFLSNTRFTGYQGVSLPFGLSVPGHDLAPEADAVFPQDLSGKTVLDVGCYYGFFLHEARRRGAARVVGIEMDPERAAIAREIARLKGDTVEIEQGDFMRIPMRERFDVVLCLNISHHLDDPLAFFRKLAAASRGTVVTIFAQPSDRKLISRAVNDVPTMRWSEGWKALCVAGVSLAIRALEKLGMPVMAVGDEVYFSTFYISKPAFVNLYTIHQPLFSSVEFKPAFRRTRVLALCKVPTPAPQADPSAVPGDA